MPRNMSVNLSEPGLLERDIGTEEAATRLHNLSRTGPTNIYVGKRNFIHQLMDVALLMANVSQLKASLSLESRDKYFYPLLVFICLSILLQIVFTLCMLYIRSTEKDIEEYISKSLDTELPEELNNKKRNADRLDKYGNVLVLFIIVSNVLITGFGVESHGPVDSGTTGTGNGSNV